MRESIRLLVGGSEEVEISPLLSRVADLDAALQMGFSLTMADVTIEEFNGLRMLRDARAASQERDRNFEEAKQRTQGKQAGF